MDVKLLQRDYYGIPLGDWLLAAGIVVIGLVVLIVVRRFVIARLSKVAARTSTKIDDFALEMVRRTRWYFLTTVLLFFAVRSLPVATRAHQIVHYLVVFVGFVQGGVWGNALLAMWRQSYIAKHSGDAESGNASFALVDLFARILLWTLLLLLALDNLNIKVTALVTGLGITGIAVALAVQSALGDVLAAFFIVFDKPFVVGDLIAVDTYKGVVERIGLRSTRLRSTTGELIIMANGDITRARLRNYRRLVERRVSVTVGIAPGTPADKLDAVRGALEKIVKAEQGIRSETTYLKRITKDAIEFEAVYHVTNASMTDYLSAQQAIGLAIAQRLAADGVGLVSIEPNPAP